MAAFLTTTSGIGAALGALVGSLLPGPGTIIGGILGGIAGDEIGRRLYKFFFPKAITTLDVPEFDDGPERDMLRKEGERARINRELQELSTGAEDQLVRDAELFFELENRKGASKVTGDVTPPASLGDDSFGIFLKRITREAQKGFNTGGIALSQNDQERINSLMESMYYEGQQTDVIIQPIIKDNTKFVTVGSDSQNTFIGSKTISGFNISDYFYERGAA